MPNPLYASALGIALGFSPFLSAHKTGTESQPAEVAAVLAYVMKSDYPEVYQGKPYRVRLRGYAVGDVDGDGCKEVFLLADPHFQQTPPIQVFRIGKDRKIKKLVEGLAPGPLVHAEGERMDAHTLGVALDATVGKGESSDKVLQVARQMLREKSGSNIVVYRNYFHADMPDHGASLLDMTDRTEFQERDKCEGIQFSMPDDVEVGAIKGVAGSPRLAVLVGQEIYLYAFTRITLDGFFEKSLTRLTRPPEARHLLLMEDGTLAFMSDDAKQPAKPISHP